MSYEIKASGGPVELFPQAEFTAASGFQRTRRWRGLQADLVAIKETLDNYVGSVVSSSIAPDVGPWFILTAVFGGVDALGIEREEINKWNLVGNDLELDLWRLPKVRKVLDGQAEANAHLIRKAVMDALDAGDSKDNLRSYLAGNLSPKLSDADLDVIIGMYVEMLKGVTSFTLPQVVLHNVRIVKWNFDTIEWWQKIGKIWRTESLKSAWDPYPDVIRNSLPEGYWLQRTPRLEWLDVHRYILTMEWWFSEDYSKFIYGEAL